MTRTHAGRSVVCSLVCSVLLLAVTACSGDDSPPSGAPTPAPDAQPSTPAEPSAGAAPVRDDTEVEPTWSSRLDVIGQPQVEDGVAVVLTKAPRKGIRVVAVDAVTGEQLWARPWSPGAVPTGYSLAPLVATSRSDRPMAVFSVPPRDLTARSPDMWRLPVVALDLRTGEEVTRTRPLDLLTPLSSCDDERDVCFGERGGAGGQRLDLETGRLAPDPAGTPAGARGIGAAGLFATSDRPGEELGVARDGEVLWSTPIGRVMGETVSSDTGWIIEHDEDADRYIGWMRAAIPPEQRELAQAGRAFSYDVGVLRLVGFGGADGTVLWTRDGAEHSCLGLDTETPTVRCVWQGRASYDDQGELVELRDGTGVVEGFDPQTGETTWSLDIAPDALEDAFQDRGQKVAGDETVLVGTADGAVVVDIASGTTTPADGATVFTCAGETVSFEYAVPYYSDGEAITRRYGGPLFRPCDADGADRPAYGAAAVRDAGTEAGDDVFVLAGEGTLSGFDLSG